jgi:hypothetical protein
MKARLLDNSAENNSVSQRTLRRTAALKKHQKKQPQDSQHWRVVCVVYSLLCVAVLFGIGQLAFCWLNICSFSLQHCAAVRAAAPAIEDRLVQ